MFAQVAEAGAACARVAGADDVVEEVRQEGVSAGCLEGSIEFGGRVDGVALAHAASFEDGRFAGALCFVGGFAPAVEALDGPGEDVLDRGAGRLVDDDRELCGRRVGGFAVVGGFGGGCCLVARLVDGGCLRVAEFVVVLVVFCLVVVVNVCGVVCLNVVTRVGIRIRFALSAWSAVVNELPLLRIGGFTFGGLDTGCLSSGCDLGLGGGLEGVAVERGDVGHALLRARLLGISIG